MLFMIPTLSYSSTWLLISLAILIFIGITFFLNLKPRFVHPKTSFYETRRKLYIFCKYITLSCVVLLPINIRFITGKQIITQKLIPIQILFDVSLSMTADDIEPSRFVAAKKSLLQLLNKLDGYYTSIITFSGIPFVHIPFSQDTSGIITRRKSTNLWDFPPVPNFVGTAIWDALLLGLHNLEQISSEEEQQPGIIILLTDGDSNKGFDPEQVLPLLQKKQIPVFTLGMGEQNYLIGYDHFGTPVKTSLNIPLLENIAHETWWEFYRVLQYKTLEQIFQKIAKIIKIQEKDKVINNYFELNKILLWLLIICLTFSISMKLLSFKKIEKYKKNSIIQK